MVAPGWCLFFSLLLITLSHSSEISSENAKRSLIGSSTLSTDSIQDPEPGPTCSSQRRAHGLREKQENTGLLSLRPVAHLEDDGPSLSPVRLEVGPGTWMKANDHDDVRGPAYMRGGTPPDGEFTRKGRKQGHLGEYRKHGGRNDKGRPKGPFYDPEPRLDSLLKDVNAFEDSPDTSLPNRNNPPTTEAPVPMSNINKHPLTPPPASTKPQVLGQKAGRGKSQGEVMPTLDMTLFDWTDYEDMRPADTWPSNKRKDKRRSKTKSSGNTTLEADVIEPCDHHFDCLSGGAVEHTVKPCIPPDEDPVCWNLWWNENTKRFSSCCDLREHECKPHNRGLNNKCYDDCMCEEGLRCYAKFHRKRRVTRRRGRCVEPESANSNQGAFITI